MFSFATELVLKPVIADREKAMIGVVEDLVLNTDNGELVGILVREGFGKRNLKTLSTKDILSITKQYYLVSEYAAAGEIDEIVRIKEVLDKDIKVIGSKVVTVLGTQLGRVRDYTLEMNTLTLNKIYVDRGIFSPFKQELVIGTKQIVSIEKDLVTVDDTVVKDKKAVHGTLPQATTG